MDLHENLTKEKLAKIKSLKNTEAFATMKELSEKDYPMILWMKLLDVDVTDENDLALLRLNQIYVDAVKQFIAMIDATTPEEVISSFEEDFVMPNYTPQEKSWQDT